MTAAKPLTSRRVHPDIAESRLRTFLPGALFSAAMLALFVAYAALLARRDFIVGRIELV